MFVSQDFTLHKTRYKNPNRKQNARSVTVKLVSLTCVQSFHAVISCSSVVTLQFSFCWHKHGVRAVTASCLFLYTSAGLMQCSPFTLPTRTLLLPGLTTSFSGSSTGMRGIFFASTAYTTFCVRNGLCW